MIGSTALVSPSISLNLTFSLNPFSCWFHSSCELTNLRVITMETHPLLPDADRDSYLLSFHPCSTQFMKNYRQLQPFQSSSNITYFSLLLNYLLLNILQSSLIKTLQLQNQNAALPPWASRRFIQRKKIWYMANTK